MCTVSIKFFECLSCVMISIGNMYTNLQVFFNEFGILQLKKWTHCAKSIKYSLADKTVNFKKSYYMQASKEQAKNNVNISKQQDQTPWQHLNY